VSRKDEKSRIRLLTGVSSAMFVFAGLSQARVHLLQRDDIIDRATKTDRFVVARPEFAKRGAILDREGRPLAQDEDTRYLTVMFDKVPRSSAFYMDLAAATGIPATEFATMAEAAKAPVDWRKPISPAQASLVQDVKTRWRADGVGLSRSGRRNYALGESAASLLGYMSDKSPQAGVELGLNSYLSGINGKIVGIVDREGNYLPMRLDRQTVRRKDGKNLTLTIDSELQQAATEAVKHAVDVNKAEQGVAIVMSKTGDILAMASWPTFDPNRPIEKMKGAVHAPEYNTAYMSALEPGSTFKILSLAIALDEGVVQPNEDYYCRGSMVVGKTTIACDRQHGAHGLLDPEMAIARSCNLAAATWAMRVGREDFVDFMKKIGLFEKPGLGLPRESRGLFNEEEYAKTLQLAANGFGQSMNATPLALCSSFAMLANDGKRVYPRLVAKVGDQEQPIRTGEQIIKPETTHEVLHMMRAVLESERGTGKSLRIPGYEIGGKTGTAQKKNFKTGTMKGGGYVSNFIGFVPAEQPEAVILVMVDNPKGGSFYGSTVAGPAFKSIAQSVIRRLRIPPTASMSSTSDEVVATSTSAIPVAAPRKIKAPNISVETRALPDFKPKASEPKQEQPAVRKRTRTEPKIEPSVKAETPVRSIKRTAKPEIKKSEPARDRRVERSKPATNDAPVRAKTTERKKAESASKPRSETKRQRTAVGPQPAKLGPKLAPQGPKPETTRRKPTTKPAASKKADKPAKKVNRDR